MATRLIPNHSRNAKATQTLLEAMGMQGGESNGESLPQKYYKNNLVSGKKL